MNLKQNLLKHSALQYTIPCCCSHHPESGFHINQLFKGRLLYRDDKTEDLYYGPLDDPDKIKILPPGRENLKRKAWDKYRTPDEHKSLISWLVTWRSREHAESPLAAVQPVTSIIDDASIVSLSKLLFLTDY